MPPLTSTYDENDNRIYNWPVGNTGNVVKLKSITNVVRCLPSGESLIRWAAREAARAAVESNEWSNMSDEEAVDWLKARPFVIRDKAATKGTAVHRLITARLRGHRLITARLAGIKTQEDQWETQEDQWEDGHGPLEGYVKAAMHFIEYNFLNPKPGGCEIELANPPIGVAGTCDLVCRDEFGKLWIVDWKSGKGVYPKDGLQALAYAKSIERLQVNKRLNRLVAVPTDFSKEKKIEVRVVHLRENGSWRAYKPIYNKFVWETFIRLIHIAQWDEDIGTKLTAAFHKSTGGKSD